MGDAGFGVHNNAKLVEFGLDFDLILWSPCATTSSQIAEVQSFHSLTPIIDIVIHLSAVNPSSRAWH